MRKILFRAKRIDNSNWIVGYLWVGNDRSYIIPHNVGIGYDDETKMIVSAAAYEICPETICWDAGLTDKNGTKIFKGDIVEIAGEDGYFVINWDNDTAKFTMDGDGLTVDFDNYWGYETEVVGNIFDNPELVGRESEE